MAVAWSVSAEVNEFDEALDWFRSRFPVTKDIADALGDYAGPRAWTIAGVAQLDVVLETYESLFEAIRDGTPFEEWQKKIEDKLTKAWGSPKSGRVETIFRNATQQAYNAGRERQLRDPDVLALRPYHQFDGIADSRQSAICRECDGTILPADHPWWDTHSPQLHHRCRSRKRALTAKQARRKGITALPPEIDSQQGFGKRPDLSSFEPDESKYPFSLLAGYRDKQQQRPQPKPIEPNE